RGEGTPGERPALEHPLEHLVAHPAEVQLGLVRCHQGRMGAARLGAEAAGVEEGAPPDRRQLVADSVELGGEPRIGARIGAGIGRGVGQPDEAGGTYAGDGSVPGRARGRTTGRLTSMVSGPSPFLATAAAAAASTGALIR